MVLGGTGWYLVLLGQCEAFMPLCNCIQYRAFIVYGDCSATFDDRGKSVTLNIETSHYIHCHINTLIFAINANLAAFHRS